VVSLLIPQQVQKIIVAPLNWGLGHAARSIPIIQELISQGKKVHIASDGAALELLQKEFPQLPSSTITAYMVRYNYSSLAMIMLSNSLNVSKAIQREHQECRALVKELKADMVISDSRFGFRSESVPSVIITHQLNPLSSNPILKYFLEKGNRFFLNNFDECWVPDDAEHSLSGILSQNSKVKKVRYLGKLSRFKKDLITDEKKIFDLAVILSGPEPARTKLETQLIKLLSSSDKQICLIRGTKAAPTRTLPTNWTIHHLANSLKINKILLQSKAIVSRSGYTSIMDYVHLGIGAYLIPTPGQSEQEYLAEYLDGKESFRYLRKINELLSLLS